MRPTIRPPRPEDIPDMSFGEKVLDLVASRFGVGVAIGFGLFLVFYFTQDRAARFGGWLSTLISRATVRVQRSLTWISRERVERRFRSLVASDDRTDYATKRVKLVWIDGLTSLDSFFNAGRFIVRMPTTAYDDSALVDAAFLFVSKALLPTQKRYLSNAQRQAIDLYVSGRLFKASSPTLHDDFVARYQTDFAADELAYQYIREFERLARYGLFDEILLRELEFLGHKALPPSGNQVVARDVDALLQLLARISRRQPNEEINLTLERRYVRVGVVLVGKAHKVDVGPEPWVNYVRAQLASRMIDSVHLLAASPNRGLVDGIARMLSAEYSRGESGFSHVLYAGTTLDRYHLELRTTRASLFTPDGDTELMSLLADRTSIEDIMVGAADGRILGSVTVAPSATQPGRIRLDDPAIDAEVACPTSAVDPDQALVGGDRVSLALVETDSGLYAASAVRRVLELSVASGDRTRPAVSPLSVESDVEGAVVVELLDIDLDDVRLFVDNALASSDEPLPLAQVANELIAEFGEALPQEGWLGYGSLKPLLRATEVGEIHQPPRTAGWLLDPARHERPESAAVTAVRKSVQSSVVERVCAATGAPRLSSEQMRSMFQALEAECAAQVPDIRDTREMNALTKRVRDRCEDLGVPVTRSSIDFVVNGYRFTSALRGREAGISAAELSDLFRENLRRLIGREGLEISPREMREIDAWVAADETDIEVDLAGLLPERASSSVLTDAEDASPGR